MRRQRLLIITVLTVIIIAALAPAVLPLTYTGTYILAISDNDSANPVRAEASLSTQPSDGLVMIRAAVYVPDGLTVAFGVATASGDIYVEVSGGGTVAYLYVFGTSTSITLSQAPSGWVYAAIMLDFPNAEATADIYVGSTNIGSGSASLSAATVSSVFVSGVGSASTGTFYLDDVEVWWWPPDSSPPATGTDLVLGNEQTLEGTDTTTNLIYSDDFEDQATDFNVVSGTGAVSVLDASAEGVGDPNPPWGDTTTTTTTTTTSTPSYAYEMPITISNVGTVDLTDYTARVVVPSSTTGYDDLTLNNVYFVDAAGNPLYYFAEYKGTGAALFWVKVPNVPAGGSTTIYMRWGSTNPFNNYNDPTQVFIFWDDFETWEGWQNYDSGTVSQSSDTAFSGAYSLKKDTANDPNGGLKNIGTSVVDNYCVAAWLYRPSVYSGGNADRISVVDDIGNGYGFAVNHESDYVAYDIRSSYTGYTYNPSNVVYDPLDEWYFAEACVHAGTLYVKAYKSDMSEIGSSQASISVKTITTVMVAGGYHYYVDNLRIVTWSPDVSVELGTTTSTTTTTTTTPTTTTTTTTSTTSSTFTTTTTTSGYQTLTTTTAPLNPPQLTAQYRFEGMFWGGTEFINNEVVTDGYVAVVTPQADVVQFSHVITSGLVQVGFHADPGGGLVGVAVGGYYSEGLAVVYNPSVDEIQLAKVSWSGSSWTFISTLASWRTQYAEPFDVYVKFGVTGSGGVVSICVYAGGVESWYELGEDKLQGALTSIPYIVYIGGVDNAVGDIVIIRGDYVVVRQGSIGAGTPTTSSAPLPVLPMFLFPIAHAEDVGVFWVELTGTDMLGSSVRLVVWDNGNGDADPTPGVVMLADLPVVWPLDGYLSVSYPVEVDPAFMSSITELSGAYESYLNNYYTTTPLYQTPGTAPTLPPPLAGGEKYVAFFVIVATALVATQVLAPVFVFAIAGEAALFTYWGWLSVPESAMALFFLLGVLALARARKGS